MTSKKIKFNLSAKLKTKKQKCQKSQQENYGLKIEQKLTVLQFALLMKTQNKFILEYTTSIKNLFSLSFNINVKTQFSKSIPTNLSHKG